METVTEANAELTDTFELVVTEGLAIEDELELLLIDLLVDDAAAAEADTDDEDEDEDEDDAG